MDQIPASFAAALEAAASSIPSFTAAELAAGQKPRPDGALLAAAQQRARQAIWQVDNLGRSQDERDLYSLIDDISLGARAAYPETLCRRKCSACCRYPAASFAVTEQEWAAIRDYIQDNWDQERIAALVGGFWNTHGPYMRRLALIDWLVRFPLPLRERSDTVPLACPFLSEDSCTVYPVRPTFCRCFGTFTLNFWKRQFQLYGCLEQAAVIEPLLRQPGRTGLPHLNPILDARTRLTPGRRRHILAIWLAQQWPRHSFPTKTPTTSKSN